MLCGWLGAVVIMILDEALHLFPSIVDQAKEVVMDVKLGDLHIPKGSTYISLGFPFTMTLSYGEQMFMSLNQNNLLMVLQKQPNTL